jgi:glycosyltransferase involved in cell wall biosynthesis
MKILMLAPEPFFQPRGTPISVYFRIKALSDLGHWTDLITYPLGEDKEFQNFRILRIPNLVGIRSIKIGPSLAKIPLDLLLLAGAFWTLAKTRYDVIFSHEEAAGIGAALGKIFGTPHIYDMHSSLPQQLENFKFSHSPFLRNVFLRMERFVLKNSHSVIVICQDLLHYVEKKGFGEKAVFLENFIDFADFEPSPYPLDVVWRKKKEIAPHGEPIILYAGNFEPYQGIPLLVEAFAKMADPAVLLIVGGTRREHELMKLKAKALGVGRKVVFYEKVPPSQIPLYISLSDVLVSPRLSGTNTPLKIYSFLKSGRPIVATNLWTHTQVLDETISILVAPEPKTLAQGLSFALHSDEARARARAAKDMTRREYIYPRYLEKMSLTLNMAVENFRKR